MRGNRKQPEGVQHELHGLIQVDPREFTETNLGGPGLANAANYLITFSMRGAFKLLAARRLVLFFCLKVQIGSQLGVRPNLPDVAVHPVVEQPRRGEEGKNNVVAGADVH